jgi:hypothetical protein
VNFLFCFVNELFVKFVKLGDFWCAIVVADFASCLLCGFVVVVVCFLFGAAIAAVEGGGYLFFLWPSRQDSYKSFGNYLLSETETTAVVVVEDEEEFLEGFWGILVFSLLNKSTRSLLVCLFVLAWVVILLPAVAVAVMMVVVEGMSGK